METGFNVPVAAIESEPAGGIQALWWQAGQQGHSLRLLPLDFATQAGGLGHEGEAGLLGGDGCALEDADFVPAFVSFPAASLGFSLSTDFGRVGCFSAVRWGFREKRPEAAPARGV